MRKRILSVLLVLVMLLLVLLYSLPVEAAESSDLKLMRVTCYTYPPGSITASGKTNSTIKLDGYFPCLMIGLEDLMACLLKECPDSQENALNTFVENVLGRLRSEKHEGD